MKILGPGFVELKLILIILLILLVLALLILAIVWTVRYVRKKQEEYSGKAGVGVMFCPKCGNQLSENARFCNKCGTQVQARQVQQAVENQAGNQNATYPKSGVSAVQNQAQVVSKAPPKPSISGARIAAFVVAALTVCTSFMTWYTPASGLSSIVNSASAFMGPLSSGSIPSLEESYTLWMLPGLISDASTLLSYVGEKSDALSLLYIILYITLILFVIGVVLVVVSIVQTFNRTGGKAALVWANLSFLVGAIVFAFIHGVLSDYADGGTAAILCAILAFVGLVVSGISKDPEWA